MESLGAPAAGECAGQHTPGQGMVPLENALREVLL
jgi:hypothetical protein